jgi:hypothetical protein
MIALIGPALGTAVYCAYQVSMGNGLLQFRIGFIDVPKYLGAGASYLDVLILDGLIVLALIIGLGYRYYHFRHERDFIKKYNIDAETGFKSLFSNKPRGGGNYDRYDSSDHGEFDGSD